MSQASALTSLHIDLYRYWQGRRRDGLLPGRADINPAEIVPLLPHLSLVDIVGGRFRYRLAGTRVVEDTGRELTGAYIGASVQPPEYAAAICAVYEHARTRAVPIFAQGGYRTPAGAVHSVSRLLLPLAADGVNVDMMIVSRVAHYPDPSAVGIDWLGAADGTVEGFVEIGSEAEAAERAAAWEARCIVLRERSRLLTASPADQRFRQALLDPES
ncbi:PAS domain-containing protein [Desertibaculum subflavum]|uniref:PAS domain-containing protein n=1 Tax=Desertibaculum subflavum TaxID=2268458 RepID=UPI000E662363